MSLVPSYRDGPYLFNVFFDQLGVSIIVLTYLISGLIVMARKKVLREKHKPGYLLLLILMLSYILVEAYLVSDLFRFYIFFEASLIPTFIIILSWGVQPERLQAGTYILIYMVTSSLPLLFFILYMYLENKHLVMYLPFWNAPSSGVVGIW